MRLEEAHWVRDTLLRFVTGAGPADRIALNLGSGTRKMREVLKPHVNEMTLQPLSDAGFRIVHSDMFAGDGIELQGDLFDPAFQQQLQQLQPALVYFCNILEHLDRRHRLDVPHILDAVVPPGGLLLITAPLSYPYHADPIDTYYRVTPQQIAELFPGYQVLNQAAVNCGNYGEEFRRGSPGRRIRKVLRLLVPFVRPKRWLTHAHRFLWMNRPYRISCVLMRKPPAAPGADAVIPANNTGH